MSTLMIGYDLNRPGQNYTELLDDLESFGTYWHCLDSTWFVVTTLTTEQVRDRLLRRIDTNDRLVVVDVTGRAAAWTTSFDGKCQTWLRDHL